MSPNTGSSSETPHSERDPAPFPITPAKSRLPIGRRLLRFGALLIPAFRDIRDHRPIFPPLVLIWIVSLTAVVALRPLIGSAMAGQPPGMASMMETVLWGTAIFAPILLLLKAGFLVAIGWAVMVMTNAGISARLLFSILLYAEAILAFQAILFALFAYFSPGGMPISPTGMQAPITLATLVSPTQPVLFAMAQAVSLFHLPWYIFLVIAIRRCAMTGWVGAFGLPTLFMGLWVGFSALRVLILP